MKRILPIVLLSIYSCTPYLKVIPLKGTYSNGNFEAYSDKSKDHIWDNIIDFFAKNGLSIRIIDRSSGLIISGNTSLKWTYENSKGEPVKKDAWVVIQKVIDKYSKKPVALYGANGEWNVRIKESAGKTLINVNLVNPSYTTLAEVSNTIMFKKGAFQSTGKFENMIYDAVK